MKHQETLTPLQAWNLNPRPLFTLIPRGGPEQGTCLLATHTSSFIIITNNSSKHQHVRVYSPPQGHQIKTSSDQRQFLYLDSEPSSILLSGTSMETILSRNGRLYFLAPQERGRYERHNHLQEKCQWPGGVQQPWLEDRRHRGHQQHQASPGVLLGVLGYLLSRQLHAHCRAGKYFLQLGYGQDQDSL